jgi:type I restriction enzyme M protein
MNMILHDNPTAETKQGNTLANPLFKTDKGDLKTFDYVVANPPFSDKRWSTGLSIDQDPFDRFVYGTPPGKQGDYAYLLHIVRSLKSTGKGACILPHGVLFRGNAEAEIRRNLIQRGYIQGIIGLPANLFYGTGIPACIVVIDKQDATSHQGIFMVDGSGGYMKDGNKNRLRDMDIHRIVDVFTKQLEVPKFSRLVPLAEIERNEFNLNIPRYIDSQQAEDVQYIRGHLQGGIPVADVEALGRYWSVCPQLKESLFQQSSVGSSLLLRQTLHERLRSGNSLDRALSGVEGDDRHGYLDLAVSKDGIKSAIFTHPEFIAFSTEMVALFDDWRERHDVKGSNDRLSTKSSC